MLDNEKEVDLISPLHIYKMFSEIENEALKVIDDLDGAKVQKENADLELEQLGNQKIGLIMSRTKVMLDNQQYDKKITELNTREKTLKKDISDCIKKAHGLMNEHKRAQEKLKEASYDPMFYHNKMAHLREQIQNANEELAICKKQYQEDFQKYGFSLKREQTSVQETPKPQPQPSALDELRRERTSRQQVFLNLEDK